MHRVVRGNYRALAGCRVRFRYGVFCTKGRKGIFQKLIDPDRFGCVFRIVILRIDFSQSGTAFQNRAQIHQDKLFFELYHFVLLCKKPQPRRITFAPGFFRSPVLVAIAVLFLYINKLGWITLSFCCRFSPDLTHLYYQSYQDIDECRKNYEKMDHLFAKEINNRKNAGY